jgi:exoribonuclease R
MEYYTHFTSPLRRFADFITHEQLSCCIESCGQKIKYNRALDEEIEWANRARLKNKKLRQCVVEGFLNLYLYQNKEKIVGKAMALCLGLKSVTLYLPFYNIIKEVNWNSPVMSSGKDAVTIKYMNKMGLVE